MYTSWKVRSAPAWTVRVHGSSCGGYRSWNSRSVPSRPGSEMSHRVQRSRQLFSIGVPVSMSVKSTFIALSALLRSEFGCLVQDPEPKLADRELKPPQLVVRDQQDVGAHGGERLVVDVRVPTVTLAPPVLHKLRERGLGRVEPALQLLESPSRSPGGATTATGTSIRPCSASRRPDRTCRAAQAHRSAPERPTLPELLQLTNRDLVSLQRRDERREVQRADRAAGAGLGSQSSTISLSAVSSTSVGVRSRSEPLPSPGGRSPSTTGSTSASTIGRSPRSAGSAAHDHRIHPTICPSRTCLSMTTSARTSTRSRLPPGNEIDTRDLGNRSRRLDRGVSALRNATRHLPVRSPNPDTHPGLDSVGPQTSDTALPLSS